MGFWLVYLWGVCLAFRRKTVFLPLTSASFPLPFFCLYSSFDFFFCLFLLLSLTFPFYFFITLHTKPLSLSSSSAIVENVFYFHRKYKMTHKVRRFPCHHTNGWKNAFKTRTKSLKSAPHKKFVSLLSFHENWFRSPQLIIKWG